LPHSRYFVEVWSPQPRSNTLIINFGRFDHWSKANMMNINMRKTKEMVIGPVTRNPPTQVVIRDGTVDRVLQFTLIG